MTKRTRTQQDQNQWQAQRDERMSDLMQQLETGVEAIQTSEDFQRYLRTAATFHQYRCPCPRAHRRDENLVRSPCAAGIKVVVGVVLRT